MLDRYQVAIDTTKPLEHPRGERLPLVIWALTDFAKADDATIEDLLTKLAERGIAMNYHWVPSAKDREWRLDEGIRVAKMQKTLGMPVTVNANRCFYALFDGSKETAHIDENGETFFDTSFAPNKKIGCTFAHEGQWPRVRAQLEYFCDGYVKAGVAPDYISSDWEIDGPMEWNGAWDAARRCVVCRKNSPNLDDFTSFQKTIRQERNRIQRELYVATLQKAFPNAKIGNYAEYPSDGLRYWYDWFEDIPDGAPYVVDQSAKYRRWYEGFGETGYTLGMPVVYTWQNITHDYDFKDNDYRWVYDMLLVATNACKSRDEKAPNLPLATFVYPHTVTRTRRPAEEAPTPLSDRAYRELLWHILLRGSDALYVFYPADEAQMRAQTPPAHEVWAASLEYNDFFLKGESVTFDVPSRPGDVVSGRALGDRVLVRRSHFGEGDSKPIEIPYKGMKIVAPVFTDECRILTLK